MPRSLLLALLVLAPGLAAADVLPPGHRSLGTDSL